MNYLNRILLVISVLVFTACVRHDGVKILKMAHSLPTDHPVHAGIMFMSKRLSEISDGTMRLDVYPGGQLGSEREQMELLQIGSLAMTKVSSSPMEGFVPEMKIFGLPYLFRDSDHYWRFLNSEIGKDMLTAGENVGLRGLGYYDAGSRSFYTVDMPVKKPSDLNGLKIRVQQSKTAMQMVKELGGSPTPISWGELYVALDQGVVDGAENNLPSFQTSRHYEVAKFFTLNEHTYVPDIVLISSYVWNHLEPQQQIWLQQAMDESIVYQRGAWEKATQKALKEVTEAGVEIIYPDKTLFAEKVQKMLAALDGTPEYELIKRIEAM